MDKVDTSKLGIKQHNENKGTKTRIRYTL